MSEPLIRTGARILVEALRIHGVDLAFCVAGESYIDILDALYDYRDEIRLVTCRHEASAANMAEAYGKLTCRPGVCLVTRGPGACHAAIALHTAHQDSTPLLLLVGQIPRGHQEREAFQEIDYRRMFGELAKWVAQIDQAERVPEMVHHALHVAVSGRPGPVVLALPEDMLAERSKVADCGPYRSVRPHPGREDMAALRRLLAAAERPLMLLGGSGWDDAACLEIAAFAKANGLPVCCGFRRHDLFDNTDSNFVGDVGIAPNPKLIRRIEEADLLLVVGARLGEVTTQGYTILGVPEPGRTLIHVHAAAEELGRVFRPTLAVHAGMPEFAAAAAALEPVDGGRWRAWTDAARRDYLENLAPQPYEGAFDPGQAMLYLRERLPPDAIVTVDAGNFSGWPQRFLQFRRPGRLLGPTSGAMGYSVPAGVAASLVHPERMVLSFAGDGSFLMSAHELATALHHGAKPVILVFNNAMYGTIRMHQERLYPGRVIATDLTNPDFAALARAYGAHGERVERTEDFAAAFETAVAAERPAVLDLAIDPELITTRARLSAIRDQARARLADKGEAS